MCLALHESPVDRRHVVTFRQRQHAREGAAVAARHVLGAEDGAVVLLQLPDARLEFVGRVVVVKRDDIGEV